MSTDITFPTTGITVRQRATLLAIDDAALPFKKNLCYYLSKPDVRREPVLLPTRDDERAPDYYAPHFYGTVLHDGGKFRMWYYAVGKGNHQQGFALGPMCYAESEDGIHWTKPNLGLIEINGSRHNNALVLPETPHTETEGITLIKDDDDPNPQRRYKLAYNARSRQRDFTIRTATSADGIHWQAGPERIFDSFLEQASFYKHNGLYIVNGQNVNPYCQSEGGNQRGRQGYVFVSPDFDHWLQESAESFILPEPTNPAERGITGKYRQVHLGVGAASFGNVLVGLYCIWYNAPQADDWFGSGYTSGDLGLVVSNDGIRFREPVPGHIWLSRDDSPVTPVANDTYATILCQANGILNVGDETRIYHGRWRNTKNPANYGSEVALATLPRDRWGALGLFSAEPQGTGRATRGEGPDVSSGSVWSAPVVLPPGATVVLNADGAGQMRVEIGDERFNLLPGFSGEHSGKTAQAGGLDCRVAWPQGDLARLAGQRVRLRVHLERAAQVEPRLYALYLHA